MTPRHSGLRAALLVTVAFPACRIGDLGFLDLHQNARALRNAARALGFWDELAAAMAAERAAHVRLNGGLLT